MKFKVKEFMTSYLLTPFKLWLDALDLHNIDITQDTIIRSLKEAINFMIEVRNEVT